MDAFIGKPMSPESLESVLVRVLAGGERQADGTVSADAARASLAEDIALMGPERTGRMVELFIETTPERVRDLSAAIAEGDLAAAGFAAHSLRNSASSVGLVRLAERLEALEAAAQTQQEADLADLFDGFEALYRDSTDLLSETWTALRG